MTCFSVPRSSMQPTPRACAAAPLTPVYASGARQAGYKPPTLPSTPLLCCKSPHSHRHAASARGRHGPGKGQPPPLTLPPALHWALCILHCLCACVRARLLVMRRSSPFVYPPFHPPRSSLRRSRPSKRFPPPRFMKCFYFVACFVTF